MKIWKSLLVILLLSLGSWGSYELYHRFILSRPINSLDLISNDVIFLFETHQADFTWQTLQQQALWEELAKIPVFETLNKQLVSIDSLVGEKGFVSKTLRNKQVTLSYHAVGSDKFSLLYTVNFGVTSGNEFLKELQQLEIPTTRFQTRKYSNKEIIDIFNTSNSVQWSITLLNNVLLISSSSFVIEEAIRLFLSEDADPISHKLSGQSTNSSGFGRLLLSSKGFAKLLNGVSTKKSSQLLQELKVSDHLMALNLEFEKEQLIFKGPVFGLPEVDFLPAIQAQFHEFETVIPLRTHTVTQFNLKDFYETQKIQHRSFEAKSTVSGEVQTRLIDRGFYDYLSGEQYFLELESVTPSQKNLALLLKSEHPEQAWQLLKEYRDTTDFYPVDQYLEQQIVLFPEENFPAHLFNGRFAGFSQTYITQVGSILIMSNSAKGMKWLIDDYSQGNTWAKNPEKVKNLLSPTTVYSKTFILTKIRPQWSQTTNPSWSTFIQKFRAELQPFTTLGLRVQQTSSGPEATLFINYSKEMPTNTQEIKSFELANEKELTFSENLTYGPKAIKNFNDGTEDLIVQDQNQVLYLINSTGEQVYTQQLDGPLIADPIQIDYYTNGKLQVLLATAEKLYAIDRLGDPLPGFPIALVGEKITHLSLVDYDNNKSYRFFIATEAGNLWLLYKSGQALEGWNPMRLGEPTLGAPFHARVPGKGDFMVALGISSKLYLFNRRGVLQAGSPLQLPTEISGPLVLIKGANPILQGITTRGEIVELSFDGEILKKTQLQKANRDDRFRSTQDQKRGASLFLLEQFNKVQLFDNQLSEIMTVPKEGNQVWVGYFDFGPSRKIIAITDLETKLGYIYDSRGTLLINSPLPSNGEIQVSHHPKLGQYHLRTREGKRLMEFLIPD